MHVNCADFVYKAIGELIQVLYLWVLLKGHMTFFSLGFQRSAETQAKKGTAGHNACLIFPQMQGSRTFPTPIQLAL